jgi:PAS domain S-box-containing protein
MTVESRKAPATQVEPSIAPQPEWMLGFDVPGVRVDPSLDQSRDRQLLEAVGVAVYTTDPDGRITFYNDAAARFWGRRPELGELWCGSLRMYWPDGRPLPHDECPMAIALREHRSVRGYEAIAERPDGTRAAFVPYPTVLEDADGNLVGAVNVIIDVTDQRRAEAAANAAGAARDEFLGVVSHELRTPVTTIFGNAQLLGDRTDLPHGVQAMVADIATDAERLLGIVENLLTLARGDLAAEFSGEPQVLAQVLSRVVSSFERRHPGRSVELAIESPHGIVEADEAPLELLIGNLLTNADKYSPPSATIEVTLRETDAESLVLVRDRGIGVRQEEVDDLFTTFHRAEAAKRMASGLGIGLSACKQIVEMLGGRIWASARDGGGSEFGFALPRSTEALD